MSEAEAGVESELLVAGGELARAAAIAREQIAARLFMAVPPVVKIADRYLLGDRIGAGGQGAVWRARDLQLDREVAIKVVHAGDLVHGEAANLLLRREAQMLGRLAHPGIVTVFDLGVCRGELFGGPAGDRMALFVVMELVEGVGLDQWLRTAERSTDEILDVIRQVAAGLAAVHERGLVHCDVKPGNILVDGASAKLADFGLAHATRSIAAVLDDNPIGDTSTFRSLVTGGGVTLRSPVPMGGTPRYMAPEQMTGGVIDARADEFALAATLFEALYGRAPHEGRTLQALRAAKLRGAPNQPDESLGKRAYAARARSRAEQPRARHGDVVRAVEAITDGRRADGRRLRVGLASIAVLGMLGLAMPGSTRCEEPTDPVVDESAAQALLASIEGRNDDATRRLIERVAMRLRMHAEAQTEARASACAASRVEVVDCLDRVEVAASAAASALADLDERGSYRALQIVEAIPDPRACFAGELERAEVGPALDPDDGAAAEVWAQLQRARTSIIARKSRAALDILDEIDTTAATVLANDVMQARGDALFKLGRFEESIAVYEQLYARADANGDSIDAARAAADAAFATGVEMQHFDEGLAWVRHGESQLQRMSVPAIAADLANTRGSIYFRAGRYPEARAELERAMELAGDRPTRRLRSIRENLGVLRFVTGDPEAIDFMNASHLLIVAAGGEEQPDAVAALANVGNALMLSGRLDEARVKYDRALEVGEAVFGADSVELARLLTGLAELDEQQGDHAAALARLRRAAALRERVYPEDHPERVQEVVHLANLLLTMGDLDGVAKIVDANVDRFAASFLDTHPLMVDFTHVRGELAVRRGRYEEGARLLGSVVATTATLGRDREDLTTTLLASGREEIELGRVESARAYVAAASVAYDELSAQEQQALGELRSEIERVAAAPPT